MLPVMPVLQLRFREWKKNSGQWAVVSGQWSEDSGQRKVLSIEYLVPSTKIFEFQTNLAPGT